MAYPSDNKPRRRKQAVPSLPQMIRRRAASPNGVPKMGVGLMGPPVMDGGIPMRRRPGWQGQAQNPARSGLTGNPVPPGANPGPRPQPGPNPFHQPPGGAPGPVVGPPNQGQRPGYSGLNPNTLLPDAPGSVTERNPLEHLDWWSAHGWKYNPQTGRFRYVAGQGDAVPPGANPGGRPPGQGGGTDTGGGAGGGTGGGTGGGGDANGDGIPDNLPLDAYFEAQRRQLNDALMARLGYINPQREQIGADRALQEARLNTNEGVDTNRLLEQLASRGAFGGGVQVRDQGYLGTDYLRQRQDLASQVAQSLSGLSQQESEAQSQYSSGLMEALLALAQRQAASQYAVTPNS